jgi:hypothetical protein
MRKKLSRSVAILFFGALSLLCLNSCSQSEKIEPSTLKSACDYVDATEKIVAQVSDAEVQKFVEEIEEKVKTQKLTTEEQEKIMPLIAIYENGNEIVEAMQRAGFRDAEYAACENSVQIAAKKKLVDPTFRSLKRIKRRLEIGKTEAEEIEMLQKQQDSIAQSSTGH